MNQGPVSQAGAASVHGHEVIDLLYHAAVPMTRDELSVAAERAFGRGATFHTCSAGAMSLDELVAFLIRREKVVEEAGRLRVRIENVCGGGGGGHNHSHDHDGE